MIISPRLLGGIFRGGLCAVAGLACCLQASGQDLAPSNPLRKVRTASALVAAKPAKAEPVKPKVMEAKVVKAKVVKAKPAEPKRLMSEPTKAAAKPKQITRQHAPSQVRQASFGLFPPLRQPRGFVPPQGMTYETSVMGGPAPIMAGPQGAIQGEVIYEGAYEGVHDGVTMMGAEVGDCCGGVGCSSCCMIPCPVISFKDTELFAGVHGFTGPRNRGQSASFGFHEGINWGTPVPCTYGAVGAQIGVRATQSSFSGADFTDSTRNQVFLTGGLFRRVDWGLQGGVVFDYLSDDWYSDIDLTQLRAEASWVFPCNHEFGFWFTAGLSTDTQTSVFSGSTASQVESWEPTDLYAFFYRRRFASHPGAEGRIFAGFTGPSDGLIGADASLPLGPNWAVQGGFGYLIPSEATGTGGGGHREESWNVAISLVWYPGCRSYGECNYFGPLFDVAGNGTFMVDRR